MAESPDRRAQRAEGLLKALYKALRIGQSFVPVTIVYVIANFLLIGLKLDYVVTCISLAVLGISFLYKLTEYLTNRYCFIDAYLVMVYRAVLEKLNNWNSPERQAEMSENKNWVTQTTRKGKLE